MNETSLWEIAKTVYSIGILAIGIVLVPLAIMFLWVLPGALRVGRQLAKAITRHAQVLERDADAADAVRRIETRVGEMHEDVQVMKSDLAEVKSRS